MKRKLALLMAFMMAATLVPAQPADAASKNTISKTVSATSDTKFLDVATAPALRLTQDGPSVTGAMETEYFELHLSGDAKWLYSDTLGAQAGTTSNVHVQRLTESILGVKVQGTDPTKPAGEIKIPMHVDLNGTGEGAQKVSVVPKDSSVSSGEYTYANVGETAIKFRVQKKEKISRGGKTKVQLILDEVTSNSFDGSTVKLRLPKDFAWGAKSGESGGTSAVNTSDDRILEIKPDAKPGLQSYYVSFEIIPGRNAKYGDVDVTVEGNSDVSPSSLVIAEYVDFGVMIKADKVLNVIAGKDVEGKYRSKLTIEEPATASLQGRRYMEFKFVDENGKDVDASLQHEENLKLVEKSGDSEVLIDGASIESNGGVTTKVKTYKVQTAATGSHKDTKMANEFDLYVDKQSDKTKAKYELEVPFVVESGFTGKLFLKVKGAGAEEQTVQIADVKAPVTFEVKGQLPQVKIGLQKQPGQDIAIKETEAGALQDYTSKSSSYAEYNLETEEKFSLVFKSVKHSVDGDLGIKKVDKDGAKIIVQVDRKSTKPSTINLKDITVTLDRTVPYGEIKLKGNFGAVKERHDLTNTVKKFDYFTTVTPVSDDKRITTVFTIGEKSFTEVIGGVKEEKTADVAPFIKDNRTMLPVRYVANAIGAIVNYDPSTRVATFTKNQVVVSINIDKDVMYANGSPVKLDAKPANVEGRIFLPIANIAQAFGLKHGETIIWNQENKTVTILPQDATKEEIEAAKAGKVEANAVTKEEMKKDEMKDEKKDEKK